MLTLVNRKKLIEAGHATRLGADWPGQRCLAKTRQGKPCKNPVVTSRKKCRMHGGKSTGATTVKGQEEARMANWKHGHRSKAHVEKVRQINGELRRTLNAMRREGYIP